MAFQYEQQVDQERVAFAFEFGDRAPGRFLLAAGHHPVA
jgi:hypothetical protein